MAALGAAVTEDNAEVVAKSQMVFIAVKPNDVASVLASATAAITPEHVIVSIAAGVTIATLESVSYNNQMVFC